LQSKNQTGRRSKGLFFNPASPALDRRSGLAKQNQGDRGPRPLPSIAGPAIETRLKKVQGLDGRPGHRGHARRAKVEARLKKVQGKGAFGFCFAKTRPGLKKEGPAIEGQK
jgi:hypothetical protein